MNCLAGRMNFKRKDYMKTYVITYDATITRETYVKALDEKDAIEKFWNSETFGETDLDLYNIEIEKTEELE